jgi:hypothetical protein
MRYRGVELHKRYAGISVRDEEGAEARFVPRERDFAGWVEELGPEDAVALEASSGALYWAAEIQKRGAACVVVDAYRFRIIRDSCKKSDRRRCGEPVVGAVAASPDGRVEAAGGVAARSGGSGTAQPCQPVSGMQHVQPGDPSHGELLAGAEALLPRPRAPKGVRAGSNRGASSDAPGDAPHASGRMQYRGLEETLYRKKSREYHRKLTKKEEIEEAA